MCYYYFIISEHQNTAMQLQNPTKAAAVIDATNIPSIITRTGKQGISRFIDFFVVNIRNPNTRFAYARGLRHFFAWCDNHGIQEIGRIQPVHVAAYIEGLPLSPPTVKQRLAAIRMLFDWLVIGQVIQNSPATSVKGPKHVVTKGKTPVLTPEEARQLLDSCDADTVAGLRDRALIGLMLYSFARISAAVNMNLGDYFPQQRRMWVRLHEKGGKFHTMPTHHNLETYIDNYIGAAGINFKTEPLFQSLRGKSGQLTGNRLSRVNAWNMIQRRAKDAGIETHITSHSFRATGITTYMMNGGTLEKAQKMAAHSTPRTTKLYDRSDDEVTLDEVERIVI